MRSVIHYALQSTGFVIEIAFYRTWYGPDTRDEPELVAGIAMYHPQWDMEMESIENSTQGRKWKKGLSNFFEGGFDEFLNELRGIQELLSTTVHEVEQEEALRQAAMDLQNAMVEPAEEPAQEAEAAATQFAIDAGIVREDITTPEALENKAAQQIAYQVALDLQKELQEDASDEQRQARADDIESEEMRVVLTRSLLDD